MTHKITFVLATAIAISATPQIAHASCSGQACSSFSYENGKFTNKDRVVPIRLKGCYIKSGSACASPPANFDVTIDADSSKPVSPPTGYGSAAKVDVSDAQFIPSQRSHVPSVPSGNTDLVEPKAIKVTNGGKIPLKVVILDAVKFSEIGRTPDYKIGSFDLELTQHVSKYHWEVFAPGDKEPCQKQRDETKPAITVRCDHTKESEKLPPLPVAATVGSVWADQCNTNGAGGAKGTCCARLRMAEPHCRLPPGWPPGVAGEAGAECDTAEKMCQAGLH
jgi:hypothetical protein